MQRSVNIVTAVFALLVPALVPQARAAPCTDGVDCYCDRVQNPSDPLYDPNLLFCEDFEDPRLNISTPDGSGWFDKYPGQVNGCWSRQHGSQNVEGPESYKCVNIVQPAACDSPDSDCVFAGNNSLGLKFRPGATGGIVGRARFAPTRTIGYTYVYKYSSNFINGGGPIKTNEFGDSDHCLLGCNTNNIRGNVPKDPDPPPPMSGWMPRAMSIGVPEAQCPAGSCFGRILKGVQGINNFYHIVPTASDYREEDHPIGAWGCHSFHIRGWGTSNATIRAWVNDRLVIHVEGADLTNLRDGGGPIASFSFNNYYNGGYPGSSVAYIYQDNIHVTSGPEPISCASLGFDSGTEAPEAVPGSQLPDPAAGDTPEPATPTVPGGTETAPLVLASRATDTAWIVTATYPESSGPYQFLFDCAADGSWDGVIDQAEQTATYECARNASALKVWAWDQGTGSVIERTVDLTQLAEPAPQLGPPGRPTLVID